MSAPQAEHARGGFGVDVNVELGSRRDVPAFRECAAHDDDLSQMTGQARFLRHGQRDIGERGQAA